MKLDKLFYQNLLTKYFLAFQGKDLVAISELFSDDIVLKDWVVELNGKEKILKFNEEVFGKFEKVHISFDNFFHCDSVFLIDSTHEAECNMFACPIRITLDDISLDVLDLISFDNEGKIISVTAYKK